MTSPPDGFSSSLSPTPPLTPSRSFTPYLFSQENVGRKGRSGIPKGEGTIGTSWRQPPLLLNTPEFREAWDEWIEYRTESGKKYRWPTTGRCFDKALKKCLEWGVDRSIAAIDHSIEMGYRGLFEPRSFDPPDKSNWEDTWKPGACL